MRGFGKGRRGGRTENARKGGTAGGGRVQHVKIHRQAAAFVHKLVVADATKRKGVSVKTLTLGDASVVNPKATYALTVETLRYLSLLEQLVEAAGGEEAICGERHLPPQLLHVLIYDTIFGQGCLPLAGPERCVLKQKERLQSCLQQILERSGCSSVEEMVQGGPIDGRSARGEVSGKDGSNLPRFARVNLVKCSVKNVLSALKKQKDVGTPCIDKHFHDLLVFPPGTDLHDHPLVKEGKLILQGKASCMTAHALSPEPSWTVIDACAAPGNKTTHLASLMGDKGQVIAFDKDPKRLKTLESSIKAAGSRSVQAQLGDFLAVEHTDPKYAGVDAILLDPSCSGSGTVRQRLDDILPSARKANREEEEKHQHSRVAALARFQKKALRHALRFPNVKRVAYSTCSVNVEENEDVVADVLPLATQLGFKLRKALPQWHRRGLKHVALVKLEEAGYRNHHLKVVRTDPSQDGTDGFFVALFERRHRSLDRFADDGGGAEGAVEEQNSGSSNAKIEDGKQRIGGTSETGKAARRRRKRLRKQLERANNATIEASAVGCPDEEQSAKKVKR